MLERRISSLSDTEVEIIAREGEIFAALVEMIEPKRNEFLDIMDS
jgi:hypothetical protein